MWADPEANVERWGENERGISYTFGAEIVTEFLKKHDLDLICRAHQVSFRVFKLEFLGDFEGMVLNEIGSGRWL